MMINIKNVQNVVLVAINIAKVRNDVLVQLSDGTRKKFRVANKMNDYKEFIAYLTSLKHPCHIGLETTANYHCPIAYHLQTSGFHAHFVSSLSAARTREARYNSWDKNDPKMRRLFYIY